MAHRPDLQTEDLPAISTPDASSAVSPARGKEMRANLLSKLRPPPLVHQWDFWHDRQDSKSRNRSSSNPTHMRSSSLASNGTSNAPYEDHLTNLHTISDVREFWSVFNNFDVTKLPMRDSIHLFHKGVKPVWEDPRNEKGGCWTFRVPKDKVREFWVEVCMMAIGEKLQDAVASDRITFIDDICGISLSVRFTSTNISIWNRDAEHTDGTEGILKTVLTNLPPDLVPKESAYYYKKHFEHKDFQGVPRRTSLDAPKEVAVQGGEESLGIEKQDVVVEMTEA